MEMIYFNLFLFIVGFFILFAVIEKAVQSGINKSIIGDFLEKKYGIKDEDNDLDT